MYPRLRYGVILSLGNIVAWIKFPRNFVEPGRCSQGYLVASVNTVVREECDRKFCQSENFVTVTIFPKKSDTLGGYAPAGGINPSQKESANATVT